MSETEPEELAFAMFLVVLEFPNVQVTIGINLKSASGPLVILELPFINFALLEDADADAALLLPLDLPKIYFAVVFDEFKIVGVQQIIHGE